ncbi:MAG: Holliday junction branch migration protein RuvA [Ruminococcaceae bacterium]|nr:Holliday junction branch migration protein RuvA [Oscillospiraceae bacterium]
MIYYLFGELAYTDMTTAVIDVGGVGYKCTVSGHTLGYLSGKKEKVKLFTYMNVREDNVELFGFCNEQELASFKLLTSVSGVGPKVAMAILSLLSPEKFALAVSSGDSKTLAKAQGVGAKTAARIVLELKDKVGKELGASGVDVETNTLDEDLPSANNDFAEAVSALMVLGYTRGDAVHALKSLNTERMSLERMIREALTKLMK